MSPVPQRGMDGSGQYHIVQGLSVENDEVLLVKQWGTDWSGQ